MLNLPEIFRSQNVSFSIALELEDMSPEMKMVSGPQEYDEKGTDRWEKITHYVAVVSDE